MSHKSLLSSNNYDKQKKLNYDTVIKKTKQKKNRNLRTGVGEILRTWAAGKCFPCFLNLLLDRRFCVEDIALRALHFKCTEQQHRLLMICTLIQYAISTSQSVCRMQSLLWKWNKWVFQMKCLGWSLNGEIKSVTTFKL